jgi:hypothetical protein
LNLVDGVRPELVAEIKFLTWTDDNLLRQVVYEGLREDKPAAEVRRPVPYPKRTAPQRPRKSKRRSTARAALRVKRKRHEGEHGALPFDSSVVGKSHSARRALP